MKLEPNPTGFKKPSNYRCQMAATACGMAGDAVDEDKLTEIFTFLFKSREAKTLVTIAKAIQATENQTAHHLKVLLETGRVFYIPTGGGKWGLSKSIR